MSRTLAREGVSTPSRSLFHLRASRPRSGVVVLTVTGELDSATVPQLRELLLPRLGTALRAVVVDLTGAGFVSATAFSLLIEAEILARRAGQSLRVVHTGRTQPRLLRLTKVDTVVRCYADLDEALIGLPSA
ncbi:STAS domain-containing protein [Amycolatopsis sp. H20-H5]|uniref:STAS domain-containing protein n=1 Tax=Amycolatopsis sp. H20-H5 TaxID=3046309 RepID=UPI002DB84925|nr:STAS domain-containing protein [Amycolatopsis sp. H20-H5]MEC3976080.1 STAS domain-containing protein [Amycolatopsis sp. H20-H5]